MTTKIEDTRLWQANEYRLESTGNVRVDSIYGEDEEEVILTGLEREEVVKLTGHAAGTRLMQEPGYSDDPLVALAEWVAEAASYVNGQQGSGWDFYDGLRDREINVVLESFGWQRQAGDKYQVQWDLQGIWGRGMMPSEQSPVPDVDPGTADDPKTTATLDGIDLGSVQSWRQQKSQEIGSYRLALADAGDSEVLAETGAFREITLVGEYSDTTGMTMNDFDSAMMDLIGQDIVVEYESAFPGRTLDVMVREYDSLREAGLTRRGDYVLSLVVGEA